VVESAKTYNAGNLFASEASVSNTTIENDLYWAGSSLDSSKIEVGSSGHGSVIAAGQNITLKNITVADSVRVAAQNITLGGAKIGNNITIAGETLSLDNEVSANGIYAAGETLSIAGSYKGGMLAGSQVTFSGVVDGDLAISAGQVTIGKNAQVKGNLTVPEGAEVTIEDGAQLANVIYTADALQQSESSTTGDLFIQVLYSCMAHILLAGLFFAIIRKPLVNAANLARHNFVQVFVSGLVVFIVAPLACILLLFPLVTIPIVVLMLLVMLIVALFAIPFAGSALGMALLGKKMNPMFAGILGTVVLTICAYVPYLSSVTVLFCIIFTAGYLWCSYSEVRKQRKLERLAAANQSYQDSNS
jgi:cytoskeletal protein CcmA (bactofilin family)